MARNPLPHLTTERLVLRLPRRDDIPDIVRFYTDNRAFLQPWSPTFAEELFCTRSWRDRIEGTLSEYRSGRGMRLLMVLRGEPTVVGVANFTSITGFPTYMCNLGYSLAESHQGQGLMTEALKTAIEHGFHRMGLHRIEANYMPRNVASARVLEKLGFTIEGYAENYILIDGRWEGHVRSSLTNPCWNDASQKS